MNNAQLSARVGFFFLLGIALIWVTFETLSSGKFFEKRGYTVVAGFDDLKGLKVGDDVRVAGVEVGSVDSTRLAGRRAEAVLLINPGVVIESDATATIAMSGLIGNSLVSIDRGSGDAPALADGSEIRTEDSPDFNSIMKQLSGLGKDLQGTLSGLSSALNGDGKNGPGLIQRLNQLVETNGAKLSATLTNLQSITDKINQGQGTIGKLVNDPRLHDELLADAEEIRTAGIQATQFIGQAQSIIDQVKSGQGVAGTLLYDPKAAENLRVSIENVRVVSDKLAHGQGTLGKLISDDSLYENVQGTVRKADRTLDSLNDSGPIEAVGVLANSLF